MRIDEEKARTLAEQYRKERSTDLLEKIVSELSPAVYRYPALFFRRPPDDCGDFYLYLIPRLDRLILKYRPELASFRTWFTLILKSQYLNWLDHSIRKKAREVAAFSYDGREAVRDRILARTDRARKKRMDKMEEKVGETIGNLSRLDYLILHLLYFNLDDRCLEVLSAFNKKSCEENMQRIRACLDGKKFSLQSRLKEKIRNCRHTLHELKKKGDSLSGEEKERIRRESRRLEKLKKGFYANLENLEIESVARILDRPASMIYYRLQKIRRKLHRDLAPHLQGVTP